MEVAGVRVIVEFVLPIPVVPIGRHCSDSFPWQARSKPPVSRIWPVSENAVPTPPIVTVTLGVRVSLGPRDWPQPTIGKSLVSKLNSPGCVRIAELCAGIVKVPHKLKVGPGRPRSTATLSIVRGALLRLSNRIAPASNDGPPPRKRMLGDPCQGTGKLGFARRLSA